MANDSGLFWDAESLRTEGFQIDGNEQVKGNLRFLPLYEAKMLHHFDHRFGTYEGQTDSQARMSKLPESTDSQHADPVYQVLPRYWVESAEVDARLMGKWERNWMLGWRDICRTTDQRTVIPCIFPRSAVGHTTPLLLTGNSAQSVSSLYANLCSFVLDYTARQKFGGTHLTYGYIKQIPVLPPQIYSQLCPWDNGGALADWILPRVLELTYTAYDLEPFARDVGYEGPPFPWDPERRFQLRCELDAAYFHLYGLERDDVAYVMETFPIVRRHDEKAHGSFRTRDEILRVYDKMAQQVPLTYSE